MTFRKEGSLRGYARKFTTVSIRLDTREILELLLKDAQRELDECETGVRMRLFDLIHEIARGECKRRRVSLRERAAARSITNRK